jgi:hypothetical protein
VVARWTAVQLDEIKPESYFVLTIR